MTYYGHVKTTNISQFKTHISSMLRSVRDGDHIVIMDRDIPVARVTPYVEADQTLVSRPPAGPIPFRKLSFSAALDPLAYLKEDRARR